MAAYAACGPPGSWATPGNPTAGRRSRVRSLPEVGDLWHCTVESRHPGSGAEGAGRGWSLVHKEYITWQKHSWPRKGGEYECPARSSTVGMVIGALVLIALIIPVHFPF